MANPGKVFEFDWVDAFSDVAFGGNGCAVVHEGASLDDATCMAFVKETSLVECTYTGPSDVADVRVRYFLASREIPFAGHPTIATVAAMRARGLVQDGPLSLETRAGIIPVDVSGNIVRMRQNAPEFGAESPAKDVAPVVGLSAGDIVGTPQIVSTGLPFCVTLVRDLATLQHAHLDVPALAEWAKRLGYDGTDIMEPYLVTLDGTPQGADTFARLLLAPPSPPEDPFTGSATGAAGAYLWSRGLLKSPSYVAGQGDDMGRRGRANVLVDGPPDSISGVFVSGAAHILMSGTLNL